MSGYATPAEIDDVLDVLKRARRRYALYYLRDRGEVPVEELATAVTGWSAVWSDEGSAGRRQFDEVLLSLFHQDLPKMDQAGLVSFDADERTVTAEPSPLADELLEVLLEQVGPESLDADRALHEGN